MTGLLMIAVLLGALWAAFAAVLLVIGYFVDRFSPLTLAKIEHTLGLFNPQDDE